MNDARLPCARQVLVRVTVAYGATGDKVGIAAGLEEPRRKASVVLGPVYLSSTPTKDKQALNEDEKTLPVSGRVCCVSFERCSRLDEALCGHRTAEQETLQAIRFETFQFVEHDVVFDALGDDFHIEFARERDQRTCDRPVDTIDVQ